MTTNSVEELIGFTAIAAAAVPGEPIWARAYVWMPVLWSARRGDLLRGWQRDLPDPGDDHPGAAAIRAAADQLRSHGATAPWQPLSGAGARHATLAWHTDVQALIGPMLTALESERWGAGTRNVWMTVSRVQTMARLAGRSALAQPLSTVLEHETYEMRCVRDAAAHLSAEDRALVLTPAPATWMAGAGDYNPTGGALDHERLEQLRKRLAGPVIDP